MSEDAAAQTTQLVLSEPLSWDEIRRRYPDEWVALVEIDWIEDTDEFRTARVAGHGPRRRDPIVQARPLHDRYEEIGHYFTGRAYLPWYVSFAP
jgi:hypothetical protein